MLILFCSLPILSSCTDNTKYDPTPEMDELMKSFTIQGASRGIIKETGKEWRPYVYAEEEKCIYITNTICQINIEITNISIINYKNIRLIILIYTNNKAFMEINELYQTFNSGETKYFKQDVNYGNLENIILTFYLQQAKDVQVKPQ